MQVEMTEEEYALFKKLKIDDTKRKRELEENRARAREFNNLMMQRITQYQELRGSKLKTACQYVRGVIKLRAGISDRVNASRGLTESDFLKMKETLELILPEL